MYALLKGFWSFWALDITITMVTITGRILPIIGTMLTLILVSVAIAASKMLALALGPGSFPGFTDKTMLTQNPL